MANRPTIYRLISRLKHYILHAIKCRYRYSDRLLVSNSGFSTAIARILLCYKIRLLTYCVEYSLVFTHCPVIAIETIRIKSSIAREYFSQSFRFVTSLGSTVVMVILHNYWLYCLFCPKDFRARDGHHKKTSICESSTLSE